MASLEKRGRSFRIAFRYQGIKYARAVSTRNEKAAQATLARLEDNLHRLELGTLAPPEGGDLAGFLLADGRVKQTPTASDAAPPPQPETLTLAALFADFWAKLPADSLEQSTITGMKIHQRRLEKHFRKDFLIQSLTLTQLQAYVERRSRDDGASRPQGDRGHDQEGHRHASDRLELGPATRADRQVVSLEGTQVPKGN